MCLECAGSVLANVLDMCRKEDGKALKMCEDMETFLNHWEVIWRCVVSVSEVCRKCVGGVLDICWKRVGQNCCVFGRLLENALEIR